MFPVPNWRIERRMILDRRELAAVLGDLKQKAQRSQSARLNLVLIRLACCCGLRASEIAGLKLRDVRTETVRPHIAIRAEVAKGGRPRHVPLWWDAGTLEDLRAWKRERQARGARDIEPFLVSPQAHCRGQALSRHAVRKRFHTACKALGLDRTRELTVHHGRHTFISHALAGGRTLAEVRDAAGHANISVTSIYLHVVVDDAEQPGQLFEFGGRQGAEGRSRPSRSPGGP